MYYSKDFDDEAQIENLKLLSLVRGKPAEACETDPEVRAAFEASLRQLAEDLLQYNPGLAHVLLGMGGDPNGEIHGQN